MTLLEKIIKDLSEMDKIYPGTFDAHVSLVNVYHILDHYIGKK